MESDEAEKRHVHPKISDIDYEDVEDELGFVLRISRREEKLRQTHEHDGAIGIGLSEQSLVAVLTSLQEGDDQMPPETGA